MPTAAGAKGDIVLSAPTESINDILDVLTKDDYEGERRELPGPEETSALIVRTIGVNQTTREFTLSASELILHICHPPLVPLSPHFLPGRAGLVRPTLCTYSVTMSVVGGRVHEAYALF